MGKPNSTARVLMLLALALLLPACASNSTPTAAPPPDPPRIPALPQQALTSQVQPPLICSPSCSKGIQKSLSKSGDTLTNFEQSEKPASAPTIKSNAP